MQYRTSVLYLATNSSQAGRARITHATYKTNSFLLVLRRLDSNARPPGYEPDELPTALLRDVVYFLNRNTQNYRFKYNSKSQMYVFYLELYRTSIGAIWILRLPTPLGQKAFLSPGFPSL